MLENSIFFTYRKFFDHLINQKHLLRAEIEEEEKEEITNIGNYELNCQLFLIRNFSAISNISKNSEMKTRDYEFKWQIQDVGNSIKRIIMESKSNFQTKPQKNYFYLIISEENKFILTIGYIQSRFLNKRIGSFFKEFFPDITKTFLSQSEIKDLLSIYLKRDVYRIELEVLIYRKAREKNKPRKNPIERAIDYIGEDVTSKILDLENEKKYIDTIGLFLFDSSSNESFRFHYNRYNKLIWYYGNSKNLIELLDKIYAIIFRKFNLLDNRERRSTRNHISRPIVLKLNSTIFSDKDRTINFRDKIENFPKCNYALLHSGNPFLHIILRDQTDNSTYSIKNLSNRDLMICPQIIGSNSSMFRILDLISERISEFEIVDYDQYRKEFHETEKF